MTLYTHQDQNIRRTWILMICFLVFIILLGWVFSWSFDNPIILYVVIGVAFLMNFLSYWHSDKFVLSINKAKEIKKPDNPELWRLVENLSITAGLPMPKVYIIDDPAPNAFATGRDQEHAAIAVTSGLLQKLEKRELEGVLAHELSHIGNRDMLLQTVVVILVGLVVLMADYFLRYSLYFGGGRRSSRSGGNLGAIMIVVGLLLAILSPIFASLLQMAISRKREFLADASGALLTRYPEGLASALEKISADPTQLKTASKATAHLFIANPFRGKKISKLFMTHPPTEERVAALRGMKV
jgi:heat shock protein HtpX